MTLQLKLIKLLILWSLVSSSAKGFAQNVNVSTNRTIDSLTAILKPAKHDTTRVKTLSDLSWEYIEAYELDKAAKNANEALLLSNAFFQRRGGRKPPEQG